MIKAPLQALDVRLRGILSPLHHLDGLPSLALRLYLVPVFWMAGSQKFLHFQDTVDWFGDADYGLGLPLPWLLAALATAAELGGAVLLTLGLATRWITLPLLVTMLVAIFSVHLDNGWQAIADPSAPFANAQVLASADKLDHIRALIDMQDDADWLRSSGSVVILNNGIEFAVTYAVMLLALLVLGGGRYVSLDDWVRRWLRRQ